MQVPFYSSTRECRARKAEFDAAVTEVMDRGDFFLGDEIAAFSRSGRG